MEAELRRHLTDLATQYSQLRGIAMGTVARLATGDWRFFERLDAGASFTARKYDLIISWFGANWPETADWPTDIPRPAPPSEAA